MPKDRRVIWAPRATDDVAGIWTYYSEIASLDAAEIVIRGIGKSIFLLQSRSSPGRPRNDLAPNLRSVRSAPYVVFFRLKETELEIVRILHERRDLPTALIEE